MTNINNENGNRIREHKSKTNGQLPLDYQEYSLNIKDVDSLLDVILSEEPSYMLPETFSLGIIREMTPVRRQFPMFELIVLPTIATVLVSALVIFIYSHDDYTGNVVARMLTVIESLQLIVRGDLILVSGVILIVIGWIEHVVGLSYSVD